MSEATPDLSGLSVALVTPMDRHGEVDEGAFVGHVRRMIEGGVDVLMPCGTTGEGATLSSDEHARVVALCVEAANGEAPVVAGVGSNDTARARGMARAVRGAGADGILCVTPYYNRPSQEGLFRHFASVAEAGGGLPVILYNVPGRTGVHLHPETALRLAELDPIAGIKEASPGLESVDTLLRERPEGFLVLAGDDVNTLPVLALGGDGVVSVAANEVPGRMAALVAAARDGRLEDARAGHRALLPLLRANFLETNPVPVKAACRLLGFMEAHVRLPLAPADPATVHALRRILVDLGLRVEDPD